MTRITRLLNGAAARRVLAGLVLVASLSASAPFATAAQPPAPSRQDEFVPVDQLPPQEQVPAAPLLIGAYVVAWLAILVYVWSLWRRLARVEREMTEVSRRLDAPPPR